MGSGFCDISMAQSPFVLQVVLCVGTLIMVRGSDYTVSIPDKGMRGGSLWGQTECKKHFGKDGAARVQSCLQDCFMNTHIIENKFNVIWRTFFVDAPAAESPNDHGKQFFKNPLQEKVGNDKAKLLTDAYGICGRRIGGYYPTCQRENPKHAGHCVLLNTETRAPCWGAIVYTSRRGKTHKHVMDKSMTQLSLKTVTRKDKTFLALKVYGRAIHGKTCALQAYLRIAWCSREDCCCSSGLLKYTSDIVPHEPSTTEVAEIKKSIPATGIIPMSSETCDHWFMNANGFVSAWMNAAYRNVEMQFIVNRCPIEKRSKCTKKNSENSQLSSV